MGRIAIVQGVYGHDAAFHINEVEGVCRGVGVADHVQIGGDEPLEALKRNFPQCTSVDYAQFNAGTYCPRIWRFAPWQDSPLVEHSPHFNSLINSIQQVALLTDALERIFRVVHPAPDTMTVYGSEIRNLLILACTEVEAQWKGTLVANGVTAPRNGFTRRQYAALAAPMGLGEFRRALCRFPEYPEVTPFAGWDPLQATTRTLDWYDAYNQTKHDREQNFRVATLQHAIAAVAAVEIMLRAQFGEPALARHNAPSAFRTLMDKEWSEVERYHAPPPGQDWSSINYPF